MSATLTALRVVHILASVFWVGGVLTFLFYVMPTSRALGADGQRFMGELARQTKLSTHLTVAALAAVISGLALLWIVSGGLQAEWLATRTGTTLTAGAAAGLAAFLLGALNNGPAATALARLGQEIQAAGGAPSEAQRARLATLQRRLQVGGLAGITLLMFAASAMAAFRYLGA